MGRARMKSLLLLILTALCLLTRNADAQDFWEATGGPPGAYAFSVYQESFTDYYLTTYYGVFHSQDSCESWQKVWPESEHSNAPVPFLPIVESEGGYWSLQFNSRFLHAPSVAGPWSFVESLPDSMDRFYDISVDSENRIFVTARYHSYRDSCGCYVYGLVLLISEDEGQTWGVITWNQGEDIPPFEQLAIGPNDRIYAGYDNVYVSEDHGLSWNQEFLSHPYGVTDHFGIEDFEVASNGYVFGLGAQGVLRRRPFDTCWTVVDPEDGYDQSFLMSVSSQDIIYAIDSDDRSLWRSGDYGDSWIELTTMPTGIVAIRGISSFYKGEVFVFCDENRPSPWHSQDYGQSWQLDANGIVQSFVTEMVITPQGTIIASNGSLARSEDLGATWEVTAAIHSYYLSITADGIVFAIDFFGRGTWRSTDDGMTWQLIPEMHLYEVTRTASGNLIANASQLLRSTDSGDSWTPIPDSPQAVYYSEITTDLNGVIFVVGWEEPGSEPKLLRSLDDGDSWSSVETLPFDIDSTSVMIHRDDISGNLIIRAWDEIMHFYRTLDSGETWEELPQPLTGISDILYGPNGDVYAVGDGGYRLYRANLLEHSWEVVGEGPYEGYEDSRDVDYHPSGYFFMAKTGVWRSTDLDLSIFNITPAIPQKVSLHQSYPNPFNPVTTISFELPMTVQVSLVVYNIAGQEVETLVNEQRPAGTFNVSFDGSRLSSGMYFYTLNAGAVTETRKMVLVK